MNQMNQTNNNYLAEEKIGKLMMKFSVPCIMSLLVAALYNIVDQIFIGRGVGYLGNGATNVVFPITIIALAFALLIGDGCAAFLSICLGKKDNQTADRSAGNAIMLVAGISVIYTILLAAGQNTLLNAFGATENNISYAIDYYQIIVIGIPFYMFASSMNSVIRADGGPQFAMISTLIGAVINIILDPVAIFVLHWGIRGAAIATIIGQIVSAVLAAWYLTHPLSIKLNRKCFRPDMAVIRKFLPLGISSFLTQISIVVIMGVMNNVLVIYGARSRFGADIPLTVMGIVMKVFQIVIAFVVGISAGIQPIIGYNYGAGNNSRVKEILSAMIKAEILIGLIAMLLFECFPMQIISIFGSENDLYNEFAVLSFRIYLSTILLCCIQKSVSIFLQSLGKPVMSLGLSLLRDFIIMVPATIILAAFKGVLGVLYSAPAADVISMIAVIIMLRSILRELNTKEETLLASDEEMCYTQNN